MTVSNEQNISTKPLVKIGKIVIVFLTLGLGLSSILLYFNLTYVLIALFAILAFVIAFFVIQKRLLIYSISVVTIGFLFAVSSFVKGYSSYTITLDSLARALMNQIGTGLFLIGIGLFLIVAVRAMSDMNKSNLWASKYKIEFKYPRFSIITFFILGITQIATGLYSIISGLQNLFLIR